MLSTRLHQKVGTIPSLQETSLKDLGISSGNVLIRLFFKETDVSLDDVLPLLEKTPVVESKSVESVTAGNGNASKSVSEKTVPASVAPTTEISQPPQGNTAPQADATVVVNSDVAEASTATPLENTESVSADRNVKAFRPPKDGVISNKSTHHFRETDY